MGRPRRRCGDVRSERDDALVPSVKQLKAVRNEVRDREARVEKLIRVERTNVEEFREAIHDEEKRIGRIRSNRSKLADELETEIKADREDKGEHGEGWERWIAGRRDELADLVDASEGRIDRLLERVAKSSKDLDTLRKRDKALDTRIIRITRKIERKREDREGQLTPHFHVVEFDCHNGTPVPKASHAALKAHCQSYLEPLRAKYGAVHINSGFRTIAYNASIGGASMSVHVYDAPWQHSPWAVAVDHVAQGAPPSIVQNWHEANTHPDGMGRYGSFTHVDNRNRIGWADSRWIGP